MPQDLWNPDTYISERVKQYQDWYDKKAVMSKSRYLRMRGFSVVAGSVVPVLINIDMNVDYYGLPLVKILVTLISLLVVVSVSLESVLHYREQWKNYRSTEQTIGHEVIAYKANIAHYGALDPQAAFKLFVERIEEFIRSENAATLNIMTMANEAAMETKQR